MKAPQRVKSLVLGATCMFTPEKPRMPAFMRVLYYFPSWALKLILPNRYGDKGYGSAASPAAVAIDLQALAREKFSAPGAVAQASAIAGYSTTREAVAALTMPALVIHGDEDSTVPFAWGVELANTLPNATFVAVKGAGHNFIIIDGAKTSAAILDFLQSLDESWRA